MKIKTKKLNGFTLLELLLTTAVLSILLGMGFKSFDNNIQEQNAKSAGEQVSSAIKKAKYYARSKGVRVKLNFPTGSNTYSIVADGVTISNVNNFDATSGKLPENIKILSNNCSDLNFYVDGSPVNSSNEVISEDCSITTGYSGGPQKTVFIKGNSGNVDFN